MEAKVIARELETECKRCNGTGKATPVKGQRIASVCSCAAARMLAHSHVFMLKRDPRSGSWVEF